MFADPNPTERRKLVEPEAVAQHRSLFCTRYDDCLEHATDCAWHSWSCERCSLFALRREMAVQYARANYHPARNAEYASFT
jgi:hypothetical protein